MNNRKHNTDCSGRDWKESKKEDVWKQTRKKLHNTSLADPIRDEDVMEDICGAPIKYSLHGKQVPEGWHIDHIKPVSKGGLDGLSNLQALQWRNNLSKGDKKCSDFECAEPYESSTF